MKYQRIAAHLSVYSRGGLTFHEAEEAIDCYIQGRKYVCAWYMQQVIVRAGKRVGGLDRGVSAHTEVMGAMCLEEDWLEVNWEMIRASVQMGCRIMCRHDSLYWEMLQEARKGEKK